MTMVAEKGAPASRCTPMTVPGTSCPLEATGSGSFQSGSIDKQAGGAEERVWASVPAIARHALECDMAPTDLQMLLVALAPARARAVTPAR
jgi:hypothetical protein